MRLRRYAVTVMDAWTPMRKFWRRSAALRWRDKIGDYAFAYEWDVRRDRWAIIGRAPDDYLANRAEHREPTK